MTETPRSVPTFVQSHAAVNEVRTLYVRFKQPLTLGNLVIVAPLQATLTICWVRDMAGNPWVRAGRAWWATVATWTPEVTVGVEGDGEIQAAEFAGVTAVDPLPRAPKVA